MKIRVLGCHGGELPKHRTTCFLLDGKMCVEEAGQVFDLFGAKAKLRFEELDDYNRFSPESQKVVFERLKAMTGL